LPLPREGIVLSGPVVGRLLSVRTWVLAADQYRVDLQVDLNPDVVVDRLSVGTLGHLATRR
jgi:hypothetical protein